MGTTVQVISSPFQADYEDGQSPLPWTYTDDAFVSWVYEVLMDGYKQPTEEVPDVPISLEDAAEYAERMGFGLAIHPRLA